MVFYKKIIYNDTTIKKPKTTPPKMTTIPTTPVQVLILILLVISLLTPLESKSQIKVSQELVRPLYASQDINGQVIDTVILSNNLVILSQQENWIKVINPETGIVGWLSRHKPYTIELAN